MVDLISMQGEDTNAVCPVNGAGLTYAQAIVSRGLDLALTLASNDPIRDAGSGPPPFSPFENRLGMRFLYVPSGAFVMGNLPNEPDQKPHERAHRVTIARGFFLQTTPVTVNHWHAFSMETGYRTEAETAGTIIRNDRGLDFKKGYHWQNPGFHQTEEFPVTCITYGDAIQFILWLRKTDNRLYDLPTEAQWEYACRAGSAGRYFFGPDEQMLNEYAWFWGNSRGHPHPVAQKRPNAWGFYDMLGNVWELCRDQCGLKHGPSGAIILSDAYEKVERPGPVCTEGPFRICRGGDWACLPNNCRPAKRMACSPRTAANMRGLRLAIHAPVEETAARPVAQPAESPSE